ncbi:MAG: hypothetical protein LBR16_03670 [Treponema sp.]|nr:hypothetical protein [Treponema sp.]
MKRIREAQKRHACFDPGCERWTPEEFINWHPINGMTWEERARRMRAAGIVDPEAEAEEAMYREEQVM